MTNKTDIGFSELNLIGLPIFNFSKNLSKSNKYGVVEKHWSEYRNNKKVERSIRIIPDNKYGVLTSFDYITLQAIFLFIRKNNLLPIGDSVAFKPFEIEDCINEINNNTQLEKSNRFSEIKNSLFKMFRTEIQVDKYIYTKDEKLRGDEHRRFRLISELFWINEKKLGRKSKDEYIEIIFPKLVRENINKNLVMLYSLDTFKNLNTNLSKKSFQYVFWKFYQLGKINILSTSYPEREKKIVFRKKYKDFLTVFLLKPLTKQSNIKRQIESILGELKSNKILIDYDIEMGKDDYIISITSGERFIKDFQKINFRKNKNSQLEFDLSGGNDIELDEIADSKKNVEIDLFINEFKKKSPKRYRALSLKANYQMKKIGFSFSGDIKRIYKKQKLYGFIKRENQKI